MACSVVFMFESVICAILHTTACQTKWYIYNVFTRPHFSIQQWNVNQTTESY